MTVALRHLEHAGDVAAVWQVLEDAEAAAGGELIDDGERQRLDDLGRGEPTDGWYAYVADVDGHPGGYVSVTLPLRPDFPADGELVVAPNARRRGAGTALAAKLTDDAATHGASRVVAWGRRATGAAWRFAAAIGYEHLRTLVVLGRPLGDVGPVTLPDTISLRPFVPGADDHQVAGALEAAFGATPDGGWDAQRVARRRRRDWFRAEDVLLAEEDGHVVGVHWTRRRGQGIGEVHVLGLAPAGQGRGLGRPLLRAGLAHLRDVGCHDVILWSDRANRRAIALYEDEGFELHWEDVAFGRDLA